MTVDEYSKPTNLSVTRGLGHGLDEKAIEAASQYKFKPALKGGNPRFLPET
jgi:protein TonB